jgi:hypothetical protein
MLQFRPSDQMLNGFQMVDVLSDEVKLAEIGVPTLGRACVFGCREATLSIKALTQMLLMCVDYQEQVDRWNERPASTDPFRVAIHDYISPQSP